VYVIIPSEKNHCLWGDALALDEIETDEGFSREDLMHELGRFEPQAFGYVKDGDVPREEP
jgi:hypothetical protein